MKQKNARVLDLSFLEKKKCTWTDLTSGSNSFRIAPDDTFYDISGHCFFPKERDQLWLLAYANSVVFSELKKVFNSTFHCQVGDVAKIVVPQLDDTEKREIERLAQGCIDCAREDWNSFETSWDFCQHPLTKYKVKTIEEAYLLWSTECQTRQETIITYEKTINEIFIKSLNLMDDFDADVDERDVSYIRTADKSRETRSLLSYCVGCQFGRYSLDMKGVICSSPLFEEHSYLSFIPDKDNIIPITDEEYLEDDIVARLCTWLRIVYGEDTLEQNLDFIASALGGKDSSSRDIIRNYFLNDFFKDHCANYSVGVSGRRPIYWLFDSGKQNGFKALIYLHRYNADTIGNLRIDYLHRMQRIYESEISRMQDMIDHSTSGREVAQATKRREKLTKQLKECREYDEKLAHLALSRIELDLDDGVKKNYRKIQTANDGKFYEVLADSKNIMSKE